MILRRYTVVILRQSGPRLRRNGFGHRRLRRNSRGIDRGGRGFGHRRHAHAHSHSGRSDRGRPVIRPCRRRDREVRDRGEENGQRDRRLRMSEGRSQVLDRTFHVIDRVDDRDGTQIRKQRTT